MSERVESFIFVTIAFLFMVGGGIIYFIAEHKMSEYRKEMGIICKELKDKPELYSRLRNCDKYLESE